MKKIKSEQKPRFNGKIIKTAAKSWRKKSVENQLDSKRASTFFAIKNDEQKSGKPPVGEWNYWKF